MEVFLRPKRQACWFLPAGKSLTLIIARGKKALANDSTPQFYIDHLLKDIDFASQAGDTNGISLILNAVVAEMLSAAKGNGYGKKDISTLINTVAEM